jgi:hypothetical protein
MIFVIKVVMAFEAYFAILLLSLSVFRLVLDQDDEGITHSCTALSGLFICWFQVFMTVPLWLLWPVY